MITWKDDPKEAVMFTIFFGVRICLLIYAGSLLIRLTIFFVKRRKAKTGRYPLKAILRYISFAIIFFHEYIFKSFAISVLIL